MKNTPTTICQPTERNDRICSLLSAVLLRELDPSLVPAIESALTRSIEFDGRLFPSPTTLFVLVSDDSILRSVVDKLNTSSSFHVEYIRCIDRSLFDRGGGPAFLLTDQEIEMQQLYAVNTLLGMVLWNVSSVTESPISTLQVLTSTATPVGALCPNVVTVLAPGRDHVLWMVRLVAKFVHAVRMTEIPSRL